jgi:NDP-sugar pyrophosphorylase family protein
MLYDVFVPTAGLGSRLNHLSKNLNKSLLPINFKPVISHIIEKFPLAHTFHVAIGYKGELVKDFLNIAYPDKKFNFIKISNFSGKGSGLGLTLLDSIKYFKKPFYFVSCDTFIENSILFRNQNWLGFSDKKDLRNDYRHLRINNNQVTKILEKKERKENTDKIYLGLAYIKNYLEFKNCCKKFKKQTLKYGEVAPLRAMIESDFTFKPVKQIWSDTGNANDYLRLKKRMDTQDVNILSKPNEEIWFVKDRVIKFSTDINFIKNRVKRIKFLKNYSPKIFHKKNNFYTYKYIEGELFSNIKEIKNFKKLLEISKKFWVKKKLSKKGLNSFVKNCNIFYKNKLIQRVKEFYKITNTKDRVYKINGKIIPRFKELIKKVNWEYLSEGIPSRFHGDYHFENIIYDKIKNRFTFLDWRQDFNGILTHGDMYYDLAKLMHGLIISHEIVNNNKFSILQKNSKVHIKIKRKKHLLKFEKYFCKWIKLNKYCLNKVYLLTSMIYLNIAALHHAPYNKFLYFYGINMLKKFTDNENKKN